MSRTDPLSIDFRHQGVTTDVNRKRQWGGLTIEYSRFHLPEDYDFALDGSSHYIALHDLILSDGEMTVDDVGTVSGGDLRDKMTYVPQGCRLKGWARPMARQNSFTAVCFQVGLLEAELERELPDTSARPMIYFQDRALHATMKKLEAVMASDAAAFPLIYAHTVGLVAAMEVCRLQQGASMVTVARAGGLSVAQQRVVREFIRDHIATDIGLDDLAAVSGLSRFHFARAFKTSFGVPPHRFLIETRIERAKAMLTDTRITITSVAEAVGFNSAAQFIRSFRQSVGVTPGEFRRNA